METMNVQELIKDIHDNLKQKSASKRDEVTVMRAMLNDKEFTIGVYDKSMGYIGQKSPHNEAVKFAKDIIAGSTGLDTKDAEQLAEDYEWTKKNSNFLLSNMRDFLFVYTGTGRKINIMQSADTEACLYTKEIKSTNKCIPDKDNPGKIKQVVTSPYTKLVSVTKCPKYNTNED
jgi:hypothetical protein